MTGRLLVLVLAAACGAAVFALFLWYRSRAGATPDTLAIQDFGLELMSGCCAFVVFTSPGCAPCKPTLRVVSEAIEKLDSPTELVTVDATQKSDLALAYDVRSVPTTFLITASGHVVARWRGVPELPELVQAAQLPETTTTSRLEHE